MSESNAQPIRLVLADDHALVLEGLRALLAAQPDLKVIATATDGERLMEAVTRFQPDLVVLDLQMPYADGITCLQRIRQADLPVRVLVLSAFGDSENLRAALAAEADGFALKTEPPQNTLAAIRQVAAGQIVFPAAARRWLSPRADKSTSPLEALSERERAVLALVAEGLGNAPIAEQLSVAESTVKFHLQNIFQKLGVTNRTEAAAVYHRLARGHD